MELILKHLYMPCVDKHSDEVGLTSQVTFEQRRVGVEGVNGVAI